VAEHPTVKAYLERSATWSANVSSSSAGKAKPSEEGKEIAMKISELATETAALWHAVDCPVPDCAIVWLHGLGDTEIYWQEVFEDAEISAVPELGEVRWIMPRAEPSPCTARGGALTYQWFDTVEFPVCIIVPGVPDRRRKDEDPKDIHAAVHRVHEAVLALEVEGVPADKIVIAGFGQGGALAVHSALSYPKTLGGCAMLSGYVPCCTTALKEAITPRGAATELLWLHGIHDAVVHIDAATAQAKDMAELGVRLDFRLSLDFGHETTDEELKGFRSWLISRIGKPPPPEEDYGEYALGSRPTSKQEALGSRSASKQDPWGPPPQVSSRPASKQATH